MKFRSTPSFCPATTPITEEDVQILLGLNSKELKELQVEGILRESGRMSSLSGQDIHYLNAFDVLKAHLFFSLETTHLSRQSREDLSEIAVGIYEDLLRFFENPSLPPPSCILSAEIRSCKPIQLLGYGYFEERLTQTMIEFWIKTVRLCTTGHRNMSLLESEGVVQLIIRKNKSHDALS